MSAMDIRSLAQQLRRPGARIGVGVWLLPREWLGREKELAVRLNLQPLDARHAYLDSLPEGAHFSGLTRPDAHQKLLDLLRRLIAQTHSRDCLLVHTLDLLLLGMEVDERERFWRGALEGLPYPRTRLILTLPEHADALFPPEQYDSRVARGSL